MGTELAKLPNAPWYPQTGPQSLAYLSTADEMFFGGQAGGGKSDLLVGLGMTCQSNSLILRLESTQLTSFKTRVQTLMGPGDKWHGVGPHGGILRMSEGRMIEFNGCENLADANSKFRGRAHDFKGWDELPTFPQNVWEFVNGWTRTDIPGQRCRKVGTGNPPSRPEEEWVLNWWGPWLKDFTAQPGEIRWFARIEGKFRQVEDGKPFYIGKELTYPTSRTFIPAALEDNPILEATGYRQVLQNLPSPYKEQLLYGDMSIGLSDESHQLIPRDWVRAAMNRWRLRDTNKLQLSAIGVDAARGGSARNCYARRYDNYFPHLITIPGVKTPDGPSGANMLMLAIDNVFIPVIIDITGTAGGGLFDSMRLLYPHIPVFAFVAAGASKYFDRSGKLKMRNKRTEAYWRLRDALDPTFGSTLELPPDDELEVEICAQRWYVFPAGAGLEEKEEIIKRIGRSPDKSDAVAMTYMDSDATGGWTPDPTHIVGVPQFMGAVTNRTESDDYKNPWR